jgi:hypothetical protein
MLQIEISRLYSRESRLKVDSIEKWAKAMELETGSASTFFQKINEENEYIYIYIYIHCKRKYNKET